MPGVGWLVPWGPSRLFYLTSSGKTITNSIDSAWLSLSRKDGEGYMAGVRVNIPAVEGEATSSVKINQSLFKSSLFLASSGTYYYTLSHWLPPFQLLESSSGQGFKLVLQCSQSFNKDLGLVHDSFSFLNAEENVSFQKILQNVAIRRWEFFISVLILFVTLSRDATSNQTASL